MAVPWGQFRVDSSGSHYVQVSMPGWSATARAGAPMLPHMVQVIGVPLGATLSVRVQPGRVHMVALSAPVLPVATQKVKSGPPTAPEGIPALPEPSLVVEEDPSVYSGDAEYPGVLAEVASDAVVR